MHQIAHSVYTVDAGRGKYWERENKKSNFPPTLVTQIKIIFYCIDLESQHRMQMNNDDDDDDGKGSGGVDRATSNVCMQNMGQECTNLWLFERK